MNSRDNEITILGDFNIDAMKKGTLELEYNQILQSFLLNQTIKEPTRVTPDSQSCIDHVIVNRTEFLSESGVIPVGVSDHHLTYSIRKRDKKGGGSKHYEIKTRNFKHYSHEKFKDKLKDKNWRKITQSQDINTAYNMLVDNIISAADDIAPERLLRIKNQCDPWVTGETIHKMHKRDFLLGRAKKEKLLEKKKKLFQEVRELRSQIRKDLYSKKKEFFEEQKKEAGNNPKSLWSVLKKACSPSKKQHAVPTLKQDGVLVTEANIVADVFNKYFTSVAKNIASKLKKPKGKWTDNLVIFYANVKRKSFSLKPVSKEWVMKQLKSLSVHKATGPDKISAKFLKDGAEILTVAMRHIINLSIETSKVPTAIKLAKIVPIFKKGSRFEAGNYRPISLLPIISKIIERAINEQVVSYLESTKILMNRQYGFRRGFSTETAVISLVDQIRNQTGQKRHTAAIFIDLRKAFDTVDHSLLLEKMNVIGFTQQAKNWFRSYLENREQYVELQGKSSSKEQVSCGVPQGSILGPTLFLIYINDISAALKNSSTVLYADDTVFHVSHKCPETLEKIMQEEFSELNDWLVDNKLSLALDKTELMIFSPKSKIKEGEGIKVANLKRVTEFKYLGIYVDSKLNFSKHLQNLVKKISQRISALRRQAKSLPLIHVKRLAEAVISPYLSYCSSAWFSALSATQIKQLQRQQNTIIRMVLGLDCHERITDFHLAKLNWLYVKEQLVFNQLKLIFKLRQQGPEATIVLPVIDNNHQMTTRAKSRADFQVERVTTEEQKTFQQSSIKTWNKLPASIKEINTMTKFKKTLKSFLTKERSNPFSLFK